MNRSWITALTLASVVGSGGAFVGVVAATRDTPVAAQPPGQALQAALVEATTPALAPTGAIAYQVGEVGTVTVEVAGNAMSLAGAVANTGWTTAGTSLTGAHVEVQFTDNTQLVTFSADLVGSNVVVSVTNDAVPSSSGATDASATPRTLPAITPTNASASTAPATTPAQTVPQPAPVAITAASPSDDSYESETEDHEDHDTEPNDD